MTKKWLKQEVRHPFTSGKKMNVSLKMKLALIRSGFKWLACLAPYLAARLALRFFLTPPRHGIPEWQKPYLASATLFTLKIQNKAIRFYQWGSDGPTVLLVHGWGGRGSQLGAFIHPLIHAGYRVLALDGPAHGASSGKQSDMFEFAAAIGSAMQIAGTPDAIITHSFGSACTLLALHENQIKTARLVLIGCPSNAVWITEDFADKLAISRKVISGMRKLFEHRYENRWTWENLALSKLIRKITIPTLIIHDRKDLEVPYQQAVELNEANPISTLYTTEGLGHRRILRAPEVVNTSLSFILAGKTNREGNRECDYTL
ncbi:MAG TPA: alpha/beta hydrolase [Gammaproteobacteria bacterium]|nr:alpha/beta hydrolase [Gammaproteobacteria bacterium]